VAAAAKPQPFAPILSSRREGGALIADICRRVWRLSRVFLFWAAFILTRPLGATVGDFLDKPLHDGGMASSRPIASAVIAAFIVVCLLVLPQRAGEHPGHSRTAA
jgi:uncharacterized membrane-anchored protein